MARGDQGVGSPDVNALEGPGRKPGLLRQEGSKATGRSESEPRQPRKAPARQDRSVTVKARIHQRKLRSGVGRLGTGGKCRAKAPRISNSAAKSGCACSWGGLGRLDVERPGQNNPDRSEDPWGGATTIARMLALQRTGASLSPCLLRRSRRSQTIRLPQNSKNSRQWKAT